MEITPGKWQIDRPYFVDSQGEAVEEKSIYVKTRHGKNWIAHIAVGIEGDESEADARLIAKAPLMHGKLEWLSQWLRDTSKSMEKDVAEEMEAIAGDIDRLTDLSRD